MKQILRALFITFAYIALGKLGLSLAFLHGSASPVWPPTGFALAMLLLWGRRYWPCVFVGALIVNVSTTFTFASSLAIAAGNALEAVVACHLVRHYCGGLRAFESSTHVFKFTVLAAGFSTLISATLGVTSLVLQGLAPLSLFGPVWTTWWLGNATGALLVTPLILNWVRRPRWRLGTLKSLEALGLLATILLMGQLAFAASQSVGEAGWAIPKYLLPPLLLWPAFRFSTRETATANFLLCCVALFNGPLKTPDPVELNRWLLNLQGFMAVNSVLSLAAAAVVGREVRVQEALALARDRAQTYLNLVSVLFVALDRHGKVSMVNRRSCEVLGSPESEIVGQDWASRFLNPEDAAWFRLHFEELRLGKSAVLDRYQNFLRRADGRTRLVRWQAKPVFDASGEFSGVLSSGDDITDHAQAEERFRLVVEASPNAMLMLNQKGEVVLVNRQAEALFGYLRDELAGKNVDALVPERFRGGHPASRGMFMRHPHARPMGAGRDLYALRRDGSEVPVEIGLTPIDTSEGTFVISAIVDISERNRTRAELERQKDELAASNAELEQFAYAASHDLKAPLRGIDNLSQWIEEDLAGQAGGEVVENLSLMRQRVKRMSRLLDDLLEYSRVGRQQHAVGPVDLNVLARELVETLGPKPGFSIHILPGLPVFKSPDPPLRQVLLNLVSNALKHHDKDQGRVEIGAEDLGDNVAIRVTDDGPGIDPRFHARVFQIFQTLRPRDEVEGSGIGLALVKKIAERRGGSVRLESEPGEGSTFTVLWPKG